MREWTLLSPVAMSDPTDYSKFVEHPRYGQGPRFTGLNPVPSRPRPGEAWIKLHWHSSEASRIPNTAMKADVSKQKITTMGVTHYFDEIRTCHGCRSRFIFFAAEQKYWYEQLGFTLEANCVHCVHCRRQRQDLARMRRRYEELFHAASPSQDERLEMAECCVSLIEIGIFSPRKTAHVRALLKRVPEQRCRRLRRRVLAIEEAVKTH